MATVNNRNVYVTWYFLMICFFHLREMSVVVGGTFRLFAVESGMPNYWQAKAVALPTRWVFRPNEFRALVQLDLQTAIRLWGNSLKNNPDPKQDSCLFLLWQCFLHKISPTDTTSTIYFSSSASSARFFCHAILLQHFCCTSSLHCHPNFGLMSNWALKKWWTKKEKKEQEVLGKCRTKLSVFFSFVAGCVFKMYGGEPSRWVNILWKQAEFCEIKTTCPSG